MTSQLTHDEYLERKLRSILEALVEALLTNKPADSASFSTEWLHTWYSENHGLDEEIQSLQAERDQLLRLRDSLLARLGGSTTPEVGRPTAEEECAEQAKIQKMKDGVRRPGVSATGISEDKMKSWKKPFHEKPGPVRTNIKQIIESNAKLGVLFGHMSETAVYSVIDAMYPLSVQAGSDLITQGEEGDNFYIVDEGSFDIYVQRGDAPAGKVMECGPGAMFGELALMYNAPRAATVTASSSSKVWALDRESFQMMLATAENTKLSQYEEFLSNIELFKHMTKYETGQLSDLLVSELFDEDEVIMQQGDEGSAFYILEDGEAKAFISGSQGEVEVKYYKDPGDFFGEVALITNAPRRATVRACGSGCTVLSVNVEDFDKVLGPIKEVLERNIDLYPNYADIIKAAVKVVETETTAANPSEE